MHDGKKQHRMEMWMLAYIIFILPSFVSIYGVWCVSRKWNRGGLSILLSIIHLTFLVCILMAKIITIIYENDIIQGIMKILDPFDSMIWIIFFIWSIFTTLFVVNVTFQNCDDITKQIHESFILCIFNYITYFLIFFFAFFVFDMAPSPRNSSQNVKDIYDTINKFCGGCGVFMNLLVLKQLLFNNLQFPFINNQHREKKKKS